MFYIGDTFDGHFPIFIATRDLKIVSFALNL